MKEIFCWVCFLKPATFFSLGGFGAGGAGGGGRSPLGPPKLPPPSILRSTQHHRPERERERERERETEPLEVGAFGGVQGK